MLPTILKRGRYLYLVISLLFFINNKNFGQALTLGASPYTQDFNNMQPNNVPKLPTGWTVRTGATGTTLGNIANPVFKNTWSNQTGEFRDVASTKPPLVAGSSNAVQNAFADRALALRQTAAFGDAGGAFTLQIDNTVGKSAFSMTVTHMTFDDNARTTVYTIQYSKTAGGTVWTTLGTYTTGPWLSLGTTTTYSFASTLNNYNGTVWIRIVALTPSTGSNNRDTYGIDDFKLQWSSIANPNINLTSPNPAVAAATLAQGSQNNPIYRVDMGVSASSAILNSATFVTSAGYAAGDISNFKLWSQTTAVFDGATATLIATLPGAGPGSQKFLGLSQALPIGTVYLFLTTDISCTANPTNNFTVAAVTSGSFSFTFIGAFTNNPSAPFAGGLQTIGAGGVTNANYLGVIPGNGQLVLSWTNPSCFDEVMVVVTDDISGVNSVPTGDGSLYTQNVDYNDGTNFANLNPNEFCIYKGTLSPVTITNLINGTLYYIKIFTRSGTNWSTGATISGTPVAPISFSFRTSASGAWNNYAIWEKFVMGVWTPCAGGEFPNSTNSDVEIMPTHIVTLNRGGYAVQNLVVDAPGATPTKLYGGSFTGNKFLNVYGDITCNGIIGNGAIADDICFNIGGSSCLLSGTGTFSCNRIRKNTAYNTQTTLTVDMNVNTYWNGTALYNNYTGLANRFDVVINATRTFTCNNNGSVAIDGTLGTAFGSSYGNFTVNGTLTVPGILYLTTNNSVSYPCSVKIGATGLINAATVSMAASTGTATHTLILVSGGRLNITGVAGITPFSTTNNIYAINPNSTVEYSAAGNEPVEPGLAYSNLTISGSGVKTPSANVAVGNIFTLTSGSYSQSGLTTTIATGGIMRGNGGNFSAGALGGTVSFAGNGTIDGTTAMTFNNLNINTGLVTQTLNNNNAASLKLVGGEFRIGSANQFNILTGGTVVATAGDFSTGVNGGILNFPGSGTFSGNSNPYNVYASGAVNFGAGTVTIQNGGSFRINAGGAASTNAPFYGTNSSLVYNSGTSYPVATEWTALASTGRGVPYHVQIGVNTTNNSKLNFTANTSWHQMNGNLFIGPASGGLGYELLLNATAGAELRIAGNWTRVSTGTFTPNLQSVVFNGGSNSTITANNGQLFPYLYLNKNALGNTLQLVDSIAISNEFAVTSGTFDPAAKNATLLSNATGTASFGKVGATGDVTYSGAGKFIVERFIPSGVGPGEHKKSWQLLAVPDNGGQSINAAWQEGLTLAAPGVPGYGTIITNNVAGAGFDMISGVGPSMKTYDGPSDTWIGVANTTPLALYNKKGYFILIRGDRRVSTYNALPDSTTLRSKGQLFVPISNPPLSTLVGAGQYECIGNPYASAIDFLNITKPADPIVDDAFYVWDPLAGPATGLGAFQFISWANGYRPSPGATANYSNAAPYTKIQSGQAFLVHATGAGGTISFTENAKLSGSKMVYRPPVTNQRQWLRAQLINAAGDITDGCVLAFDPSFDNRYESKDGLKLMNGGENFGITSNGKTLALEAREPVIKTDSFQYSLGHLQAQAYQFRFLPENMNANITAWLVDRYLGTKTAVSMTDSTMVNFNVTNDIATAAADRFYLVFRANPAVPGEGPLTIKKASKMPGETVTGTGSISVYPNPVADKTIKLIFRNKTAGDYSLMLINNSGQLVHEQSMNVTGSYFTGSYKVGEVAAGHYRLTVTAADGTKTVQSLVIK